MLVTSNKNLTKIPTNYQQRHLTAIYAKNSKNKSPYACIYIYLTNIKQNQI